MISTQVNVSYRYPVKSSTQRPTEHLAHRFPHRGLQNIWYIVLQSCGRFLQFFQLTQLQVRLRLGSWYSAIV